MALQVGSYDEGFGLQFYLVDDFTATSKKIQTEMGKLATATTSLETAATDSVRRWVENGRYMMSIKNPAYDGMTDARRYISMIDVEREAQMASAEAFEVASLRKLQAAQLETSQQLELAGLREKAMIDEAVQQMRINELVEANRVALDASREAVEAWEEEIRYNAVVGVNMLVASVIGLGVALKSAQVEMHFEKAMLTLDGFLGSAQKATEAFDYLRKASARNPMMGFENELKAADLMLSQGISADVALPLTKNVSDFLTVVGRGPAELNRFSRELEKIAANGKITSRELYQAAAAGIPLRKLLEDSMGTKLPESLKELNISIADISKAFEKAMAPGSRYSKTLDKVLTSLAATWTSMTRVELPMTFKAIGEAISPLLNSFVSLLNTGVKLLRLFSESALGHVFWNFTVVLSALAGVMAVNLLGAKMMAKGFGLIGSHVGAALVRIVKLEGGIAGLSGSIANLGTALATSGAFKWFTPFAGIATVAGKALQHFKSVMAGNEQQAQGFTGWLQRMGGMLMFITEAVATYNRETHSSKISNELVHALEKINALGTAKNVFTYIEAVMDFVEGFTAVFKFIGEIFRFIGWAINGALTWLGAFNNNLRRLLDLAIVWKILGGLAAVATIWWARGIALAAFRMLVLNNVLVTSLVSAYKWLQSTYVMFGATMGLATALSILTMGLTAVAAVVMYMGLTTDNASSSINDMNDSIDETTGKLREQRRAFSDAEVRIKRYKQALDELISWQNEDVKLREENKRGENVFKTFHHNFIKPSIQTFKPRNQEEQRIFDEYNKNYRQQTGKNLDYNYGGTASNTPTTVDVTLTLDGKILGKQLVPIMGKIAAKDKIMTG